MLLVFKIKKSFHSLFVCDFTIVFFFCFKSMSSPILNEYRTKYQVICKDLLELDLLLDKLEKSEHRARSVYVSRESSFIAYSLYRYYNRELILIKNRFAAYREKAEEICPIVCLEEFNVLNGKGFLCKYYDVKLKILEHYNSSTEDRCDCGL